MLKNLQSVGIVERLFVTHDSRRFRVKPPELDENLHEPGFAKPAVWWSKINMTQEKGSPTAAYPFWMSDIAISEITKAPEISLSPQFSVVPKVWKCLLREECQRLAILSWISFWQFFVMVFGVGHWIQVLTETSSWKRRVLQVQVTTGSSLKPPRIESRNPRKTCIIPQHDL